MGAITKAEVKRIACEEGFADVAEKKESMGICFIGKRKKGFQNFIKEYVEQRKGDIVNIDSGHVLGSHNGVHQWTIGQKVKLQGMGMKLFVADKDARNNVLQVCYGANHPSLFSETFEVGAPHWIGGRGPTDEQLRDGFDCEFRFQNIMPLTNCRLKMSGSSGRLTVTCVEPLRAVTPGQVAAFYRADECLGSAVIEAKYVADNVRTDDSGMRLNSCPWLT